QQELVNEVKAMRRKLIVPFLMGVAVLVVVQAAMAAPALPVNVDPNWFPQDIKNLTGIDATHRTAVGPTGITVNPMGCPSDCVKLPPPPNATNLPNGNGPLGNTGRIVLPDGISIQPNEGAQGIKLPPPPDPNWYGWYYKQEVNTTRF